jgi:hypothetical protein
MKPRKRAEIEEIVRAAIEFKSTRGEFHVLSVKFEDGKSVEIPFLPWRPRSEITLPGRWETDW